jgi:carbon monoxide dehydrogenase subunit G
MQLNGDIFISATPANVWRALNDPQVLLQSIPGAEEVRQLSPTETHLRVSIKLGPVRARFVGKILMSDVRPEQGCVLDFEGVGGAAGFAKGTSTVNLAAEGQGTRLGYTAQASVGGKLGQIGGRMIDASAKQTADQFFAAFARQIGAGEAATVDGHADVAVAESVSIARHAAAAGGPTRAAAAAGRVATGEGVRILWFVLGALATAFGFFIASALMH